MFSRDIYRKKIFICSNKGHGGKCVGRASCGEFGTIQPAHSSLLPLYFGTGISTVKMVIKFDLTFIPSIVNASKMILKHGGNTATLHKA